MRLALAGVITVILGLVGVELGAWAAEKLGYVDLYGERTGTRLARWHTIARWGLALLTIPLVALMVLINV